VSSRNAAKRAFNLCLHFVTLLINTAEKTETAKIQSPQTLQTTACMKILPSLKTVTRQIWHYLPSASVLIAVLASSQVGLGATTWDVTADFSVDNGNPNGAWSYGWMDTSFTTFTPFVNHDYTAHEGCPIWHSGFYLPDDQLPIFGVVWKNTSTPINGVATGQLALHPGYNEEPCIARWTAPGNVSGPALVRGTFYSGDTGLLSVAVRLNGVPQWTAVDSGTFDLAFPVAPGDTLDFAAFGGYGWGSTPLEATVTIVPEPGSLMVMGLAGLLAAAARSRSRCVRY
jgi:hypothetical protein